MKTALAICILSASALQAQPIKLPASFEKLAKIATETVDVNLDANLLQLGGKFLSDKNADEAKAKKIVGKLKGIYVKCFEFDKVGAYQQADIEAIRSQLQAPVWSRTVNVSSKKDGETAETYLRFQNQQITGLVVLATEPKSVTFVQIDGAISPDELADLGGQFGIPKMEFGPKTQPKGKEEE